ncbi:hypothetical protein [Desulfosporosinus sp. OT]|uniref:hypothetical protein n=1 Tax=Desulfosporosinus sp. OT TaxID=913865 RepID=UPI0002239B07|nr:hypothetical protein [Desulfosporosinus sp. OT]EGW40822.1 hypothetical protein DOT_1169 [Desulfosporosinus sp. OT]
MKKKLRIIFVWTLVSLLLQFGAYSLLNNQVQKVMAPVTSEPITLQLKATIPSADLTNVQISYAKDYIAYSEKGTLKVFNLKKQKNVFEKESPSVDDKALGVLTYQWLPDRNTLIYFYAKKNPNPITYVTDYPPKSTQQPTTQSTTPKTEDPNEKTTVSKDTTKEVPVKPRTKIRYGNPQLTELYTLELPDSDEDTAPDDRFNQTIDQFPAGGEIEEWVVSTYTNLMYLTVKNGSKEQLMEIDVMKNVRTLNKSGETIDNMAASDRYGTLYLDSKVGSTQQVLALNGTKRQTISKNDNDRILGIRDGKVYIGEVENDVLVKIKTTADLSEVKSNPVLNTEWVGSIPFDNTQRTVIGSKGQIVVYDHLTAYIVTAGQLKEVNLHGDDNYISVDGAELIQLTREETFTEAELQPLNS